MKHAGLLQYCSFQDVPGSSMYAVISTFQSLLMMQLLRLAGLIVVPVFGFRYDSIMVRKVFVADEFPKTRGI